MNVRYDYIASPAAPSGAACHALYFGYKTTQKDV